MVLLTVPGLSTTRCGTPGCSGVGVRGKGLALKLLTIGFPVVAGERRLCLGRLGSEAERG